MEGVSNSREVFEGLVLGVRPFGDRWFRYPGGSGILGAHGGSGGREGLRM